ncbi:MAG: thioredoxin [Chitinophagia bacterium]|nr:thioredoxin [Chitinophagia bacterium]
MIAPIFLLLAFFTACNNSETSTTGNETALLNATRFQEKLVKSPNVVLIDVRTPEEFRKERIGNAVNIDIGSQRFKEMVEVLDHDATLLVYCYSGSRSEQAGDILRGMGFSHVYALDGGILKWKAAGMPVVQAAEPGARGMRGMSVAEFQTIIKADGYVLVDYSATWCGPCQQMKPVLEAFTAKRKNKMALIPIDADNNTVLMQAKGIDGIPYLELYNKGKLLWSHSGYLSEEELARQTGI